MESIEIELSHYTFVQKLNLLERIWDDITRDENAFESPSWHEDVLTDRDKAFASGAAAVSDWEEAKVRIRKNVTCG